MPLRVGFHVEGWDHLVLCAYLAKLLELPENDIVLDPIEAGGRGWEFVLQMIPSALKRFYATCAQFAVVGVDNDGSVDLDAQGIGEDPKHPRHDLHAGSINAQCRWCQIDQIVRRVRSELNWLPEKPGAHWPVLIAVPVEAIEAWLLTSRAVVQQQGALLRAEMRSRRNLKQQFYGKPAATFDDVQTVALPLVRSMDADHIESLKSHSHSFAMFAQQVECQAQRILGPRDCWAPGDKGAEA